MTSNNLIALLLATLTNPISVAAIASYFTSVFKPYVENLPFARPTSDTHDSSIIVLNILINYLLLLAVPIVTGSLTARSAAALLVLAFIQMAIGATGYRALTTLGKSVGKSAGSVASVGPALLGTTATINTPTASVPLAPEAEDTEPVVPPELAGALPAGSGV